MDNRLSETITELHETQMNVALWKNSQQQQLTTRRYPKPFILYRLGID